MCDEESDVELRLEALGRILVTLTQCLGDLDRVNAPLAALRLAAACDAVRDDLQASGAEAEGDR